MIRSIIYHAPAWEEKFILNDLLQTNINTYNIIYTHNNLNINSTVDWDNIDNIIGNNILIFSSNCIKYNDILKFVQYIKPVIVFHLSDEWGHNQEYQNISNYTSILFRQYNHVHYPKYNNIYQIPLGYVESFFEDNYLDISLKLPSYRKYIWSFIGDKTKKDRPSMLLNMRKLKPYFDNENNKRFNIKSEIRDINRESIFIPSCRGWNTFDVFRLYETSSCGAIPVVVGPPNETEIIYSNTQPPWLYFGSWEEASIECNKLLNNMDYLNDLSIKNIEWWKNEIYNIRNIIKSV